MNTVELKYMPGDACWVRGQYRACYIENIVLDEQGVTYNWVNYDYGVDVTEVWDDGYFTTDDIGTSVFDSLEELEKAFPEDFAFGDEYEL
jgi:hypothetical protein